jgi:hypothetical protein
VYIIIHFSLRYEKYYEFMMMQPRARGVSSQRESRVRHPPIHPSIIISRLSLSLSQHICILLGVCAYAKQPLFWLPPPPPPQPRECVCGAGWKSEFRPTISTYFASMTSEAFKQDDCARGGARCGVEHTRYITLELHNEIREIEARGF